MNKKFSKTIVLVAVVAALSTGCRSNQEHKKLTEAGNKYALAVNQILTTAGDMRIDVTSEQILRDDRELNQTLEEYIQRSQVDEERLKIIEDIRTHNTLLKNYFTKLQEIAVSNAPDKAKVEIDGIATNLNKIGQKLQNSNLISSRNKSIAQGVTNVVINSKIRGALKEELEKRHKTILQELTIQEDCLNTLKEIMRHDIDFLKSARQERLVIGPLTNTEQIKEQEAWIQARKKLLTMDRKVTELETASAALSEFRNVYQASVEGNLNMGSLNNLLSDIDSFLALIEPQK